MNLGKIVVILGLFLLSGCAHSIHQVYVSSMDKSAHYGDQWLTVEKKDFVVLFFETDTSYVQQAYHELESRCPGRLTQVTAEHLTSYYFVSYDQKIVLKGLCQNS